MRTIDVGHGRKAIVSDEDYDYLSKLKWSVGCFENQNNISYRVFTTTMKCPETGEPIANRSMASLILKTPKGMHSDHKNQDAFDNRRENLRIVTPCQNQHNSGPKSTGSSQYKGVYWVQSRKKWKAHIQTGNKRIFLGYFTDEVEAAKVYNTKAKELFGEFAYLNKFDGGEADE